MEKVIKEAWGDRDGRPKMGAWAPGTYKNTCLGCDVEFIGDKRALNCADCAYGTSKDGGKDVSEIVKQWLDDNGFDGLFSEDGDCACLADDLAPCGHISEGCKSGYKVYHTTAGDGPDWSIVLRKPKGKDTEDRDC